MFYVRAQQLRYNAKGITEDWTLDRIRDVAKEFETAAIEAGNLIWQRKPGP